MIPGSGRSPGEGNGNALQYFCLENPMDAGAWWATVHRAAKSWYLLLLVYTLGNRFRDLPKLYGLSKGRALEFALFDFEVTADITKSDKGMVI